MNIEQLKPQDNDAVVSLYRRCFDEPPWSETWTYDAALKVINNPNLTWWVYKDNSGNIIGALAGAVLPYTDIFQNFDLPSSDDARLTAYLAELMVDPTARNQGIARTLTNDFLVHAQTKKAEQFYVRTKPGTNNYPWYEKTLNIAHIYPDGRVLFTTEPVPNTL
jgi:ribosomal protein S18 acetylase RimI-like enzyme